MLDIDATSGSIPSRNRRLYPWMGLSPSDIVIIMVTSAAVALLSTTILLLLFRRLDRAEMSEVQGQAWREMAVLSLEMMSKQSNLDDEEAVDEPGQDSTH